MISVFFDFRVYRAFVNTEIKEHGNQGTRKSRNTEIKEHGIIFCWFEAQLRWTVNEQKNGDT